MPVRQIHRCTVALNISRLSAHALIARTNTIVAAVGASPWLPAPDPPLAAISADLAALAAAQLDALTRALGTAQERNARRTALENRLYALAAYVQHVANADPASAVVVIESAGMSVKRPTVAGPKQTLAVKDGIVSGAVEIVAKAAASRASYEWAWSGDGKSWNVLPKTLQARTTLRGLTPGTTLRFRYRALTKSGVADWSTPETHIVS